MKPPTQIIVNVASDFDIGKVCEQIDLALCNHEKGGDVQVVVVPNAFTVDADGRVNHTEPEPIALGEVQQDEPEAHVDDLGSQNQAPAEDPNVETDDQPVVDAKPLTKVQIKALAKHK